MPPSVASAPGSIGKNRPVLLTASLSCLRVTPGCTVTVRSSALIDSTRFMRLTSMLMPPCTASRWPSSDVPTPNGMTGTLYSLASFTASATLAVLCANTTAAFCIALTSAVHGSSDSEHTIMKTFTTADIHDADPAKASVCETQFRTFGRIVIFGGPCTTVKIYEDHRQLKELVATPGAGRVLVIDGGASPRVGLMGDGMAETAMRNGWAGA